MGIADSPDRKGPSQEHERVDHQQPSSAGLETAVAARNSLPVVGPGRASHDGFDETLLVSPEHVLSTLESDGSRRWMYPLLSTGRFWKRRRIVAYLLAIVFITLPHLSIGGKPPILLDVAAREFTILGTTFLATDTLLLALGMLLIFLSVVLATAIAGRVWCGWACPQTVYMEFLFRPIDRLFEGTAGKGGKPKKPLVGVRKVARWAVYLVVCMLLAHTFLSYFVGVEALARWIRTPPWQHPTAFLVMAVTTGLMLFHFLFFREQLCLIACPYGRFQSAMLDHRSIIVAYDHHRGEPRKKGRRPVADDRGETATAGDCIDCNRCVAVCPTGIDIRNGLQLECVNCTQCIDACDDVMDRVGLPRGLIRFDSQDGIDGKSGGLLRARTVVYPLILLIVGGLFYSVLGTKYSFDARLVRAPGNPFSRIQGGQVRNSLRLRLVNRSGQEQEYRVIATQPAGVALQVIEPEKLKLSDRESVMVPLVVDFPSRVTSRTGHADATVRILDELGNTRELTYRLLGPAN